MSIATNNVIAKIAAVVAGLGLVAMSFAYAAPAAKADTTSDLQAQIAALMAQIQALQAQSGSTSTSASATFTKDLTVGSKGADVTALQNWLIGKGFSIAAGATGTFGAQTKAAVAAWQASAGITPAAGYFGAKSRAVANASGSTSTGGTSTAGLTGTGRLTRVSTLGDVTSDIKEGDSATSVVGASFDATDGDVSIQRVDATFVVGSAGSQSANLNKYVSSVAVYLDGKKLGSMDATSGDKDTRTWTYRFAGLNGVIKKGMTGNLYIKVTPVSSVDSKEDGKTVTAKILADGVRAVGADGISETYVSTAITQDFQVSAKTSATLTATAGSDNPKASQVAVSSSTTTGVKLLSFNLKAKNQDLTVDQIVAGFQTSDNNLNDVVSTVKLMKGDTVIKTKTLGTGTGALVTFDKLAQTIAKDATATYTIVADLKGDSAYADGTTLIASTTTSGWDVSDADGGSVTPSSQVVGNTMTLTASGISVTKGTVTSSVAAGLTGAGDIATFVLPFTVTAGDNDAYISGVVAKGAAANNQIRYGTTTTSTQGATGEPTANLAVSDVVTGDSAGAYYKVLAGTSRTFTLNVAITASTTGVTAGYVGTILNGIGYGATSSLGSTYTSNLDTFKSNDVYVTKR